MNRKGISITIESERFVEMRLSESRGKTTKRNDTFGIIKISVNSIDMECEKRKEA